MVCDKSYQFVCGLKGILNLLLSKCFCVSIIGLLTLNLMFFGDSSIHLFTDKKLKEMGWMTYKHLGTKYLGFVKDKCNRLAFLHNCCR